MQFMFAEDLHCELHDKFDSWATKLLDEVIIGTDTFQIKIMDS